MGWLLDTIDAGKIVSTGIAMTAAALLLAGRANSFGTFAAAHIMMGLGMALAAMIPAAVVVSTGSIPAGGWRWGSRWRACHWAVRCWLPWSLI